VVTVPAGEDTQEAQ
jgi:hypothetical protein